jgi:hypothetical protein
MELDKIIAELKNKIAGFQAALDALQTIQTTKRDGRRRRHMSAAARRRISKAMKLRWAQRQRAA